LTVLAVVDLNRVLLLLLALALYLGARVGYRWLLARHDRMLWVPVAQSIRAGVLDEQLLVDTLPRLLHPALRTSTAVALAHVRADRHEWDEVPATLGRMGFLSRAVVRGALEATEDRPVVTGPERIMLARSRLSAVAGRGADLPAEVLFCAGAILHGRGLHRRAFALGRRAWAAHHDAVTAYNCACALARSGDLGLSVDWLARAVADGYPRRDLLGDDDLVALRPLPAFAALAALPPAVS
jgi:hypothetical protein